MARRRPKGTGAVRKLPSGRWQARIDNGAGLLVSLGSYATKTDAAHALSVALGDQARGRWTDPTAGRLTLGEYSAEWLQHRSTISTRTAELYDSLLRNHILPTFADFALADISTRVIRQWHSRMLTAGSPGTVTVAKSYRLLRSILATAVEDGLIATNPCVLKGAGVERSPERPVATIPQVFALADAVEPRYRMLILLATFASMRFGELGALTRSSIDLDTGLIEITHAASELADGTRIVGKPKTDSGCRTVAVPAVLHDDLRAHLHQHAQAGQRGLVFVGPAGGPLRRSNWTKTWRTATTELDLGHLHFHDLRHTGNTLAAATGASTKELMTRMGHSSSRAALIYQHATAERELAIAERLSDMVTAMRS
jgi:integrase